MWMQPSISEYEIKEGDQWCVAHLCSDVAVTAEEFSMVKTGTDMADVVDNEDDDEGGNVRGGWELPDVANICANCCCKPARCWLEIEVGGGIRLVPMLE